MKKVATIILNRNLPKETDELVKVLKSEKKISNDIFVIEAGSDKINLSKNTTWYVSNKFVKKNGLRFPRGVNYGLYKLFVENKYEKYDTFLFMTNDTIIVNKNFVKNLYQEIMQHDQLGILSPCGKLWAEREYLKKEKTKYFYFIHNHCYMFKKKYLNKLINFNNKSYLNFLFDGSNFRGYGSEMELIAKCYANDFAAGITTKSLVLENDYLLKDKNNLIKTESFEVNKKLYISEGKKWMKKKYGFNDKWTMLKYVSNFYDNFFQYHPHLKKYKV